MDEITDQILLPQRSNLPPKLTTPSLCLLSDPSHSHSYPISLQNTSTSHACHCFLHTTARFPSLPATCHQPVGPLLQEFGHSVAASWRNPHLFQQPNLPPQPHHKLPNQSHLDKCGQMWMHETSMNLLLSFCAFVPPHPSAHIPPLQPRDIRDVPHVQGVQGVQVSECPRVQVSKCPNVRAQTCSVSLSPFSQPWVRCVRYTMSRVRVRPRRVRRKLAREKWLGSRGWYHGTVALAFRSFDSITWQGGHHELVPHTEFYGVSAGNRGGG